METKKVVAILIAGLNEIVANLEELKSEDGGEDEGKPARSSRSSRSRSRDNDDDDDDKNKDKDGDDEPSVDDVVKAAKAALKTLEKDDVVKLIKKHGKADRSDEIKPANRQAFLDALEKALDDAD